MEKLSTLGSIALRMLSTPPLLMHPKEMREAEVPILEATPVRKTRRCMLDQIQPPATSIYIRHAALRTELSAAATLRLFCFSSSQE
jgi:hypothetical protein